MADSVLIRLAERNFILPEYWDIRGRHYPTSDQTRRRFLTAMGVPCDSDEEIAASLYSEERRQWQLICDPVCVRRVDEQPVRFVLRLPSHKCDRQLKWVVTAEDGSVLSGVWNPLEAYAAKLWEDEGIQYKEICFELPLNLSPGYYELSFTEGEPLICSCLLIIAPESCYLPEQSEQIIRKQQGKRMWGLSVQLYSLRSANNWGIGDFGDLKQLLSFVSTRGGDFVGLNPLHVVSPRGNVGSSPYSPSSRLVHNPLYIDIEEAVRFLGDKKAAKLIGAETFQNRLCQLREGEYVPYEKIAQLKFEMLELLYRNFAIRDIGADTELGRSFLAFVEEEKDRIEVYSWFAALHEYFYEKNPAWWGWVLWPTEYRSPFSRKVREFVEEHLDRVQFYQFVEWLATSQLEQVSSYAEELGMGVGLYLDLALGSSQGGAGTWEDQSLYAFGVSMGAPADELAPQGQDWGLPPLNPKKLTESRYQIFIRVLRCAMRFSGAVRIDHVMQLMRLFWVPEGETAEHGAYVGYPLGDLLGILALESSRSRCLVIGEDLGTVPEEVRCGMDRYGVLSYKVLYFMKNYAEKSFLPPSAYPEKSLVVTSTHDLPSLRGFWEGVDLNIRRRLSLHSRTVQEMLEESREEDLAALKHLLIEHGFLSEEEAAAPLWQKKRMPSKLLQYVHLMLADTPSLFQAIQIEDLMGQAEQANLPGTVHEHPNWQRRLPMSLEQLERSPKVRTLLSGISKARNS